MKMGIITYLGAHWTKEYINTTSLCWTFDNGIYFELLAREGTVSGQLPNYYINETEMIIWL